MLAQSPGTSLRAWPSVHTRQVKPGGVFKEFALTLRSSRGPTKAGRAPQRWYCPFRAASLCGPLSSNVRPHESTLLSYRSMFKLLGALLACYVAYAVLSGEVLAKAGAGSRSVQRSESPAYFWLVVFIYAGLSLALIQWF